MFPCVGAVYPFRLIAAGVGTTGNNTGTSDAGTQTSVGEVAVGAGKVRILGGGLPMPTEANDHRYLPVAFRPRGSARRRANKQ